MHVLVLGAYGLVGHAITRALLSQGLTVTGLARSRAHGEALIPEASWVAADLKFLSTPEAWAPHLVGIDAVVNAAGALQSGGRDDVRAVQETAMIALFAAFAANGPRKLVQISAPGASPDATTAFLRTKAVADEALRASNLDWVVLRPSVVISDTGYGGTALLRTIAAVPWIQPLVMGESRLQVVAAEDVARAVVRALHDPSLAKRSFDLTGPDDNTLREVTLSFRRWLGFPPPRVVVALPPFVGAIVARFGDLAGLAGWRAPFRTTALRVLADGGRGDPGPWRAATGETLATLPEILASLASGREDRLAARLQLLFPLLLLGLSAFWIASGVIGFVSYGTAVDTISDRVGPRIAAVMLVGGALADIAIGLAMLWRGSVKAALAAGIVLSLAYLAAGTVLTPSLWLDPLGPLVKIAPVILVSLVLLPMSAER